MFATLAGGYPFGPLPGHPSDFADARRRRKEGLLDDAMFRELAVAWVTEVVDEQVAAGLAMACDAYGPWLDGPVGLARDVLAGSVSPADVVGAWRRAASGTNALVKQVLPGPWSSSFELETAPTSRVRVAGELVERLGAVATALFDAGCPVIQIDEPSLKGADVSPAERDRLADVLADLLERIPADAHVSLALPDHAPHAAIHGALGALPFKSYLVDVTAGPDAWRIIRVIPAEKGVVVGALDARTPDADDPEMLVWAATLAAESDDRGRDRVGIAPSGSLAGIERHRARRKIEQLGMAVKLAKLGPLGDVARALQPDPSTCSIGSLRRMYQDWEASREACRSPRLTRPTSHGTRAWCLPPYACPWTEGYEVDDALFRDADPRPREARASATCTCSGPRARATRSPSASSTMWWTCSPRSRRRWASIPWSGCINLSTWTIIERIERSMSKGVRRFQFALPGWGVSDRQARSRRSWRSRRPVPRGVVPPLQPDAHRAAHHPAFYARLAQAHPNLVGAKNGTSDVVRIHGLLNEAPLLRHFLTEVGYPFGVTVGRPGLLMSLSSINPRPGSGSSRRGSRATTPSCSGRQGELVWVEMKLLEAAGDTGAHMDGSFEKMMHKVLDERFPLRMLPPYAAVPDEAGYPSSGAGWRDVPALGYRRGLIAG